MSENEGRYAAALVLGRDWRAVATELGARLSGAAGRLGILYTSESFAPHLDEMSAVLASRTDATDWVSAAGYGVIASGEEHFGESGAAALVMDLARDGYRLFAGGTEAGPVLAVREAEWLDAAAMPLALAHVDPRDPEAAEAVEALAAGTGGFLVGGLTVAAGAAPHHAGGATGCLSGVALSPATVEIATALSQGCTPLGKARTVTRAQENILIELDGRPALDAFDGRHRRGARVGPSPGRGAHLRRPPGHRIGYRGLHRAQPGGARSREQGRRDRGSGPGGREGAVLPARPRERGPRHAADGGGSEAPGG